MRDRYVVRGEQRDVADIDLDAVRAEKLGAEDVGECRHRALPRRRHEHVAVHCHRPFAMLEPELLVRALGQMRANRDTA